MQRKGRADSWAGGEYTCLRRSEALAVACLDLTWHEPAQLSEQETSVGHKEYCCSLSGRQYPERTARDKCRAKNAAGCRGIGRLSRRRRGADVAKQKAYMVVPEEGRTEVAASLDLLRRQRRCGWLEEYKPILPLGSAWVAARSSNEKAKRVGR